MVGGGTPSTKEPRYWEGTVPWITSADIDENGHVHPRKFISREAIDASTTNLVPAGSIVVVTRVGLGKVALSPYELCFSQDCQAILADAGLFDSTFIRHQMRWFATTLRFQGRGTTISGLTKRQLLELPFRFPRREEQTAIGNGIEARYSRLDAALAALQRVQTNLKRYLASVLKAGCYGRLVPTEAELARSQGRDYEPAGVLLERIMRERRRKWEEAEVARMRAKRQELDDDRWKEKYKDPEPPDTTALPDLPQGWCWTTIDQLLAMQPQSLQSGPFGSNLRHSEFQERGVLVIGIDNVQDGMFSLGKEHRISERKYEALKKYTARPLDVLITVMATVGRSCVVPADLERAIITKHVYRISVNEALVDSRYLMHALRGSEVIRNQVARQSIGQTRPGLNSSILRRLAVPLPPRSEQSRIVAEIDRRESSVRHAGADLATTDARVGRLRQAILRSAFDLRIPALESHNAKVVFGA